MTSHGKGAIQARQRRFPAEGGHGVGKIRPSRGAEEGNAQKRADGLELDARLFDISVDAVMYLLPVEPLQSRQPVAQNGDMRSAFLRAGFVHSGRVIGKIGGTCQQRPEMYGHLLQAGDAWLDKRDAAEGQSAVPGRLIRFRKERDKLRKKLFRRGRAQVLGIDPEQFIRIKSRSGTVQTGTVKIFHQFLMGKDLLVAVAPSQANKIIDQSFG